MFKGVRFKLLFFWRYFRMNLLGAMEYRISFISQVIGMMLNDALWLAFWSIFFKRFQVVNGWTSEDITVLWASVTFSYGLALGFFRNTRSIPEIVSKGQLDYYLTFPKGPFGHILISRMKATALGDLLFGLGVFFFFVHPTFEKTLVFLTVSTLAAFVQMGFFILTGSLVFFFDRADTFASQAANTLIHFATYPSSIFEGATKTLLYSLVPAAFLTTLPVELVRHFEWKPFLFLILAAAGFFLGARWVFYRGLRHYESGNLIQMRD